MKIIILLCFFSGLAQSTQSSHNNKCWLQCDPKDHIALVTCSSTLDNTEPCTCVKKEYITGEDGPFFYDLDCTDLINNRVGPMTWNECHNLANKLGSVGEPLANKFFRWEDKETDEQTICYFLPEPCNPLSPGDCMPYDGVPCVAGPSDEECEPVPSVYCDAPEWKAEGLHWVCAGPDGGVVNAYTSPIPKGTNCDTGKHECSTWEWADGLAHDDVKKKAFVECAESDPGTGIWKSNPAENLLVDNPLGEDGSPLGPIQIIPPSDGICRCPLLVITEDTYNTPGLSLLCDQAYNPTDGGIENGNACTLLCDGHFKMYIECIKGQWKNTGAGYPFDDVRDTDINC